MGALAFQYSLRLVIAPGLLRLHTSGRNIVDSSGKVVILQGINKELVHDDNWHGIPEIRGHGAFFGQTEFAFDSPTYTWDKYLNAHLDGMANWGANFLRLAIDLGWWMDNAYYNDAEKGSIPIRGMIDEVISRANDRGIYVLFDPHFPYNYAVPWDAGWFTRDQYVQVMIDIATHYRDWDGVLIDFYNEAHPYPDYTRWQSACQEVVDAVRATGNDIVFLYQADWSWLTIGGGPGKAKGTWAEQYPLTGGNIIYGFHHYRNPAIAGYITYAQIEDYYWTQDDLLIRYVSETLNLPLLVGEVGGYITIPEDMTWLRNVLTWFTDKGMSWGAWLWQGNIEGWGMQLVDILPTSPTTLPTPTVAGQIVIDVIAGTVLPDIPITEWSILISSNPISGGITSPIGTQFVDETQALTVTATASSGYVFNNWEFDSTIMTGNPIVIPPQPNGTSHNLIAKFSPTIETEPPINNTQISNETQINETSTESKNIIGQQPMLFFATILIITIEVTHRWLTRKKRKHY